MKPLVVEAKEKCANCGQPISPDFNRCPYCGAPVVKEEAAPPPVPSPIPPMSDITPPTPPFPYESVPTPAPKKKLSTGWIIAIIIIAVLCLCCLISAIILWNSGDAIIQYLQEFVELNTGL